MRAILKHTLFVAAFLVGTDCPVRGQGTFQNLDFESASLVPVGGFDVQFAPAFPGWTGTVGGVQQTLALYNTLALDTSGISIIDQSYSGFLGAVIQGNYTAVLQAGLSGVPADTSLSQTGLVPLGVHSLQFEVRQAVDGASAVIPFAVTLGGQTLSYVPLASGSNYTLYGANISPWAGQTAQLSFTVFAEQPHQDNQYLFLDAIQFSDQAVPEPGVFGLCALGALLLGWRVLGRRR